MEAPVCAPSAQRLDNGSPITPKRKGLETKMDSDYQDACDAEAQLQERRRREDEAVQRGHEVLRLFRAGNAEFDREWAIGRQNIKHLKIIQDETRHAKSK